MQIDSICVIPLFSGLSERQLGALSAVVEPLHIEPGSVICREGDPGESTFILVRGSVEITKRLGLDIAIPDDGIKEKTLVHLEAPQFFGEMGILEGSERSATVIARTACDLLSLDGAAFRKLAEADPSLGYVVVHNVALVLSSRLRSADHDVVKLTVALSLALGNR